MRDSERQVLERLTGLHPQLAGAVIDAPANDPPDAIISVAGARLGLELTDIFSVGQVNDRGSAFLQFEAQWLALKRVILDTLSQQHPNLDQCDIYLRLDRQSSDEFDLRNLPKPGDYQTFARQLLRAIMSGRPEPFNRHSSATTHLELPDTHEFGVLHRHTRRAEVVWRPEFTRLNVAVDVHLPAVEAGALNTSTASLETAILRKTTLTPEQQRRIQAASMSEYYLVLGGQQSGRLPHLQADSRAGLQDALVFVRHPFERSIFDGIVLFDDLNDRVEVFCTKCLSASQKYNRLGVGLLNFYNAEMFVLPHACPRLAPPRAS